MPTRIQLRRDVCLGAALVLIFLLAATSAYASPCESNYEGPANGSWSSAANWKGGALPTGAGTVCIGAGLGTIDIPNGFVAQAETLSAQSGLQIDASGTLFIEGATTGKAAASSFADLTVEGTLSTAGSWLALAGSARVDGTIVESGASLVELESGTLYGTGTIHPQFSNVAGTIQPGGPGTIGELTFDSSFAQSSTGTLVLDLAGDGSFDRLAVPLDNVFLGGVVHVNTLGGYLPMPGETWEFIGSGPGVIDEGAVVTPSSYRAYSVSGGAKLELLAPLAVGPQPPTVTAVAGDGQATVTVLPAAEPGTGAIEGYEFKVQPGSYQSHIAAAGSTTFSSLTNGTTYTVTATVTTTVGTSAPSAPVQFTPQQPVQNTTPPPGNGQDGQTQKTEALLLGCSGRQLALNDVFVRNGHVQLSGAAAKSMVGKQVKILFEDAKQVASTTVGANGEFTVTSPLPSARLRDSNKARYLAEIGGLRSLDLKLTRRLSLEPPRSTKGTVTLVGRLLPPLTSPRAKVLVSQQLACGASSVVKRFVPSASGQFHVTFKAPTGSGAALYRLEGVVVSKPGSRHGSKTFSLPLPVLLG